MNFYQNKLKMLSITLFGLALSYSPVFASGYLWDGAEVNNIARSMRSISLPNSIPPDITLTQTEMNQIAQSPKKVVGFSSYENLLKYAAIKWVESQDYADILQNFGPKRDQMSDSLGTCCSCTWLPYKSALEQIKYGHWTESYPLPNSSDATSDANGVKQYPVRGWCKKYSQAIVGGALYAVQQYLQSDKNS